MPSPSHELISALLRHLKKTLKWESKQCTSLTSRPREDHCMKMVPLNSDPQMKYFLAQIVECYPHRMPDVVERLVCLCEKTRCSRHSTVTGDDQAAMKVCLSVFPVWAEIYEFLKKSDAEVLKHINSDEFLAPYVFQKIQPQALFLSRVKEICAAVTCLGYLSYAEADMLTFPIEPETGLGQVKGTDGINDTIFNASSANTSISHADSKTAGGSASISHADFNTAGGSASISDYNFNPGAASTSISDTNSNTAGGSSSISDTNSNTAGGSASISDADSNTAGGSASISDTNSNTAGGSVSISDTNSNTAGGSVSISDTNSNAGAASTSTSANTMANGGQMATNLAISFDGFQDANGFITTSDGGGQTASAPTLPPMLPFPMNFEELLDSDYNPFLDNSQDFSPASDSDFSTRDWPFSTTGTSTSTSSENLFASKCKCITTTTSPGGDMTASASSLDVWEMPDPTTTPTPTPKHLGKKRAGKFEEEVSTGNKRACV